MNSIFSKKTKEENTTYDTMSSLSHTKWNCKYHIAFTPKYRRKIFYGQKRLEIGKILRDISDWQEVKINRGGSLPRSCAYVCRNTTKIVGIKIYGNIKGQKQPHNFPELVKFEIQIWTTKFLVPWLLCRHGRQKCKKNSRICKKSITRRYDV